MSLPAPQFFPNLQYTFRCHAARALMDRHGIDYERSHEILDDLISKVVANDFRAVTRKRIERTAGGTYSMRQTLKVQTALIKRRRGILLLVWDWTHEVPVTVYPPREEHADWVHPKTQERQDLMGDPVKRRHDAQQKRLRTKRKRR